MPARSPHSRRRGAAILTPRPPSVSTAARWRLALPVLALAVVASGCLASRPSLGEAAPTPVFDPEAFFLGRSSGAGELSIRLKGTESIRVQSLGTPLADGSFQLVQTITREGQKPFERTWSLRRESASRWTGTLTEATGPIEATVDGNELSIHYRTGRFTTVRQRLRLQSGGRVALNWLTVRVLGVPIARIDERIERTE